MACFSCAVVVPTCAGRQHSKLAKPAPHMSTKNSKGFFGCSITSYARVSRHPVVGRASFAGDEAWDRHMYPNSHFIAETIAAFPEKAVASVEEARALFSDGGYKWLDVRTELERNSIGHVKGSIHVPFATAKKRFVDGKMEVDEVDNPEFMDLMRRNVPDLSTRLLIGDSNGSKHAVPVLMALEEAGYENLVGIKGGFRSWFRTFDFKLNRRRFGEYAENYSSYDQLGSGDSAGIHSSGAGFDRVDKPAEEFWANW